jgi:hypothetical protein
MMDTSVRSEEAKRVYMRTATGAEQKWSRSCWPFTRCYASGWSDLSTSVLIQGL